MRAGRTVVTNFCLSGAGRKGGSPVQRRAGRRSCGHCAALAGVTVADRRVGRPVGGLGRSSLGQSAPQPPPDVAQLRPVCTSFTFGPHDTTAGRATDASHRWERGPGGRATRTTDRRHGHRGPAHGSPGRRDPGRFTGRGRDHAGGTGDAGNAQAGLGDDAGLPAADRAGLRRPDPRGRPGPRRRRRHRPALQRPHAGRLDPALGRLEPRRRGHPDRLHQRPLGRLRHDDRPGTAADPRVRLRRGRRQAGRRRLQQRRPHRRRRRPRGYLAAAQLPVGRGDLAAVRLRRPPPTSPSPATGTATGATAWASGGERSGSCCRRRRPRAARPPRPTPSRSAGPATSA